MKCEIALQGMVMEMVVWVVQVVQVVSERVLGAGSLLRGLTLRYIQYR